MPQKIPSETPPAWMIEKIKKEEERKQREQGCPQPEIPLYDEPPRESNKKDDETWFQI